MPSKSGKEALVACSSKQAARTLHEGGHLASYFNYAKNEMDRVKNLLDQNAISECEARYHIMEMQRQLRDLLRKGKVALTKEEAKKLANGDNIGICGLAVLGLGATATIANASQQDEETLKDLEGVCASVSVTTYTNQSTNTCIRAAGAIADWVNPLSDWGEAGVAIQQTIMLLVPTDYRNSFVPEDSSPDWNGFW